MRIEFYITTGLIADSTYIVVTLYNVMVRNVNSSSASSKGVVAVDLKLALTSRACSS